MSVTRTAFLVFAGPLAWAAHFATIYGFTGVACARGLAGAVPWAIAAATLVAGAACGFVILHSLRRREHFEHGLGAGLAAAALLAIVWEALPVLMVRPCA